MYPAVTATARLRGDRSRSGLVGEPVNLAGLGDVPVLAETAAEIASCRSEGEDARAWKKVIEGLFFDRIDAEPGGATVGGEDHPVCQALSHEAEPSLPFLQLAVARTEIALNPAILQPMPPAARVWIGVHGLLVESKGAVADHFVASARGVARIAQIEELWAKVVPRGGDEQTIDRIGAASLLRRERRGPEREDLVGGSPIHLDRVLVGQVVRQVRAHDDHRGRITPSRVHHRGDLIGGRIAHHQWHNPKVLQRALQKWQLNL